MAIAKLVGQNFLHRHEEMEEQLKVPTDHVIVDKNDWEDIVKFFQKNPSFVEYIGKM